MTAAARGWRRAPKVAPIATPLYEQYWFRFVSVMGSMLAGGSVVHAIFKPDISIPELDEHGNRIDGKRDPGKEFLEAWRQEPGSGGPRT